MHIIQHQMRYNKHKAVTQKWLKGLVNTRYLLALYFWFMVKNIIEFDLVDRC